MKKLLLIGCFMLGALLSAQATVQEKVVFEQDTGLLIDQVDYQATETLTTGVTYQIFDAAVLTDCLVTFIDQPEVGFQVPAIAEPVAMATETTALDSSVFRLWFNSNNDYFMGYTKIHNCNYGKVTARSQAGIPKYNYIGNRS